MWAPEWRDQKRGQRLILQSGFKVESRPLGNSLEHLMDGKIMSLRRKKGEEEQIWYVR